MWCKHCDVQYDKGFTICLKCGRELVEYDSILDKAADDNLLFDKQQDNESALESMPKDAVPELLVTLPDSREADGLVERLATINIPAIVKPSVDMVGEYDIFVPAAMFLRAFELATEEDDFDDFTEELSDDELMSEFGDMEFSDDVDDVDPDEIAKSMND